MNTVFNPGPCFSDGSVVKNLLANARNVRDTGLIPGSGRSLREGTGYMLQYSCLENSKDRGASWPVVHRVAKNRQAHVISVWTPGFLLYSNYNES